MRAVLWNIGAGKKIGTTWPKLPRCAANSPRMTKMSRLPTKRNPVIIAGIGDGPAPPSYAVSINKLIFNKRRRDFHDRIRK